MQDIPSVSTMADPYQAVLLQEGQAPTVNGGRMSWSWGASDREKVKMATETLSRHSTIRDEYFVPWISLLAISSASSTYDYQINIASDALIQQLREAGYSSDDSIDVDDISVIIRRWISDYNSSAITSLPYFIDHQGNDEVLSSKILSVLGDMDHESSRNMRRLVLFKYARNRSAKLRYGAVLGLFDVAVQSDVEKVRLYTRFESDAVICDLWHQLEEYLQSQ